MKTKVYAAALSGALLVSTVLSGCSGEEKKPFTILEITMNDLDSMMESKKTFPLLIEREGCNFCEAMNAYLEETKDEHPGIMVYKIDATDFDLYRENKGDMTLVSSTEEGKRLLEIFPFYLYTPVIYRFEDGKPIEGGFGYDEATHCVSTWTLNSTINWDLAKPVYVWDYFELASSPSASKTMDSSSS
ncbi:hypothetical protein [Allobaculum mucilyticum]|uniref:hypothetical protein n=1 Tax=Allobaculum mucilyticum TaxID=2834459 RepID=UPI001E4C2B62|nr:hypothetical protein [Allobaculum mucilyticum]UNT95247.1 hypothetical protein KWG62_07745 [Allobaculum mucilyticum]